MSDKKTCHSSLFKAAEKGCTECVKLLMDKEADLKDKNGRTALMYAAQNGYLECVKLLIDKEGGIKSKYGYTALMYAAKYDHPECVKLLMDKEAGLQESGAGRTALICAIEMSQLECVKLLLPYEYKIKDNNGKSVLDYANHLNRDIDEYGHKIERCGCNHEMCLSCHCRNKNINVYNAVCNYVSENTL